MQKLKNSGITWDAMGVVSADGKPIAGSNITDLVNDVVRANKTKNGPAGWAEFADVLRSINIPRVLITNQKRLEYINRNMNRSDSSSAYVDVEEPNDFLSPIRSSSPAQPLSSSHESEQSTSPNQRKKRPTSSSKTKWSKFSFK